MAKMVNFILCIFHHNKKKMGKKKKLKQGLPWWSGG